MQVLAVTVLVMNVREMRVAVAQRFVLMLVGMGPPWVIGSVDVRLAPVREATYV